MGVRLVDEDNIKRFYGRVKPHLNEKDRRLVVAGMALTEGRGGISKISRATGLARKVIRDGIQELESDGAPAIEAEKSSERIRREGGGRKKATEIDPTLEEDLKLLIDPITRGDPESSLLWTSKSLRNLADELKTKGHDVSHVTVRTLLQNMGFSLQANFKSIEPGQHADRNEQFEYIYQHVKEMQDRNQPIISVDTKKKELIGPYKNNGREWHPKGQPTRVDTHDFENKELGHAIPFGVYDITANKGWVSVGITKDTSQFAVATIRTWWFEMGKAVYPQAQELMITADSGGSNGYRRRLWKTELQNFANETGLVVHVLHFPPNTSKWNKIEHRMFSHISKNWRGRPLVSLEVIISLIASTTTRKGLQIACAADTTSYETGIKVSDEALADVNLVPDSYHGEWNYRILPNQLA